MLLSVPTVEPPLLLLMTSGAEFKLAARRPTRRYRVEVAIFRAVVVEKLVKAGGLL